MHVTRLYYFPVWILEQFIVNVYINLVLHANANANVIVIVNANADGNVYAYVYVNEQCQCYWLNNVNGFVCSGFHICINAASIAVDVSISVLNTFLHLMYCVMCLIFYSLWYRFCYKNAVSLSTGCIVLAIWNTYHFHLIKVLSVTKMYYICHRNVLYLSLECTISVIGMYYISHRNVLYLS